MTAYYNEIDQFAAQWLRNLIDAGHIAPGIVDTRSIAEVTENDLTGFTQCHFFAGIGGWSLALRLAGWPDSRPVWTGSCPCQPFSGAGKRKGFADDRHLWPVFAKLIGQRKPAAVFGEQVASSDGRIWLNAVRTDLEAMGYAVGAADLCAAGVGAPHIRQRLYWMADAERGAAERYGFTVGGTPAGSEGEIRSRSQRIRDDAWDGGSVVRMGNAIDTRLERHAGNGDDRNQSRRIAAHETRSITEAGFTRGFWRNADWLYCRDEKYRPVEPGTFPMVNGIPGRVGMLRGYGNAIIPQVAEQFIRAAM